MNIDMKAVILAAGRGSRLYPLTANIPKCMVKVGGRPLIDRQIESIESIGIKDILVVVGYQKEVIQKHLGNRVRYREYSDYAKTNNLHTLWNVRDELNSGFICFFADLLFDFAVLEDLAKNTDDICVVIDTSQILDGTMRIKINQGNCVGMGDHPVTKSEASGNFIGIAKFSNKGSELLLEQMAGMVAAHQNDYYTAALNKLIAKGQKIGYLDIKNRTWVEIDTLEDLKRAEKELLPKLILTPRR